VPGWLGAGLVQINIILILFKTTLMHLAHSALRTNSQNGKTELNDKELQQRLDAYNTACQKYRTEIATIQKVPARMDAGIRRKRIVYLIVRLTN
jgi:uncharacterized membrane protein YukC